jgi:hypothetical protein
MWSEIIYQSILTFLANLACNPGNYKDQEKERERETVDSHRMERDVRYGTPY